MSVQVELLREKVCLHSTIASEILETLQYYTYKNFETSSMNSLDELHAYCIECIESLKIIDKFLREIPV